jgi:hypothetical protein
VTSGGGERAFGFGDKPGDDLAYRWHVVDEVGAFAGEDDRRIRVALRGRGAVAGHLAVAGAGELAFATVPTRRLLAAANSPSSQSLSP